MNFSDWPCPIRPRRRLLRSWVSSLPSRTRWRTSMHGLLDQIPRKRSRNWTRSVSSRSLLSRSTILASLTACRVQIRVCWDERNVDERERDETVRMVNLVGDETESTSYCSRVMDRVLSDPFRSSYHHFVRTVVWLDSEGSCDLTYFYLRQLLHFDPQGKSRERINDLSRHLLIRISNYSSSV